MDSLRKRRVFVLGAGFSAAAGIPMTDALLKHALFLMKLECDGIYSRIERYAKLCFENDLKLLDQDLGFNGFEKLSSYLHYIEMTEHGGGERWSDEGSREILTLKYFIAKAISKLTPDEIPKLYLKFAEQLDCYDIVLTFNWDCLLERALKAVGKEYTYNHKEISWENHPNRVFIVKMHGSINWTLSSRADGRIYQKSFDPNMDLKPFYYSETLMQKDIWNSDNEWLCPIGSKYFVQPFIILPGIGKSYDVRKLGFFWDRPSGYFYSARDAVVIGLSLSKDDFFIRFLLLDSFPLDDWSELERRTVIINPNKEDLSNYNFISDDKKIVRNKKFGLDDIELITKLRD